MSLVLQHGLAATLPQLHRSPHIAFRYHPSANNIFSYTHSGTFLSPQIFGGSFGGPTLYDNPDYTSPNAVRAAIKRQAAGKYGSKVAARDRREAHKGDNPLPRDPMEGLFRGEDGEEDEGSE